MRQTTPLRNLLIAFSLIAVMALVSLLQPFAVEQRVLAAPQNQSVDFVWNPTTGSINAQPGSQSVAFNATLANRGVAGNFIISVDTTNFPGTAQITPASQILIPANGSQAFTFLISVNNNAAPQTYRLNITAARESAPSVTSLAVLNVNVVAATATPSTTPTLTATTGPSPTPLPICQNGRETNDPGNDLGSAQLIRVNYQETHGLCTRSEEQSSGDIDWFYFGAGAGKVYTIDVNTMAEGMDLVIELYDANGNFLTGNDDFFQRNPNNTSDLRPRIQSWRAPYDGLFYFIVRDKVNSSGGDRTYTIEVRGESFGPTPTQISELCSDLFEQDGLPENARDIGPNEIQPAHVLCPVGDADWVRFYGAAGKSYFMYTDTRPYRGSVNGETAAGADTVIFLFDRDGTTRLAESDDIPNSLDSEIPFVPPVDGFYFAQIKNRGDLGNQFIRYDFVLRLCVSGDTACGRAEVVVAQPTTGSSSGNTPTPTTDPGFGVTQTPRGSATATQTRTPTLSPTQEPTFLEFSRVWQRADQPVATGNAPRSWMWGPKPLLRTNERYNDAAGGQRLVQYYDKARMEITDPAARRASGWFVSNGLLVNEMVRGQVQLGDAQFAARPAPSIPIAGDQDDKVGPTYASLARVVGKKSGDQTGEYVTQWLGRGGSVSDYAGPRYKGAQLAYFAAQTGYNIPQVFWDYLNARDIIYENGSLGDGQLMDWLFTLGYPIADPYWATVKVGDKFQTVLVQPFERRVLTYNPNNAEGWQVEMGNVGRHYYQWRYGKELPN